MHWKSQRGFKEQKNRKLVAKVSRKLNLQRQLHFHQPSHPDFPATEPDDRVNRMAARTVHIAELNPEKIAPLSSDAGGIKKLQPLIFKGCAVVVTVGLEPGLAALRLLGQVHNSRSASFLRHCSFVHHASASLYPALRALGSAPHRCIRQTSPDQINYRHAKTPPIRVVLCGLYWTRTSDPIDVNDVLYQLSQQTIGTGIIIQSSSIFVKDSFPKLEPGPFPDSNRVRNLNRREMTLQRSPHLFRLTRSPHFRQSRTAHRADVRFSPPMM